MLVARSNNLILTHKIQNWSRIIGFLMRERSIVREWVNLGFFFSLTKCEG